MKKLIWIVIVFAAFDFCLFSQNTPVPDKYGFIVRVGQQAPDFTIRYADDRKPEKLSSLKGKVVLLQFTASWCSVCRKEMPHLEKLWQENKNKNFRMIGIDLKESREKTLGFAREMKITYPLALDPGGEIFYRYAAQGAGVTRNIVIDATGKIVYVTRLYDEKTFSGMVHKLDEMLK
ncbi:MAG: TlpA family protein disulfide reductase [Bacteroidales bacterium]|nr:TlpA family protein disulfide reductase [Bacteroidales bacterium]